MGLHALISFSILLVTFTCTIHCSDDAKNSEQKEEEKVLKYTRPYIADLVYFAEPFHSQEEFDTNWVLSEAKKDGVEDAIAKYDGKWSVTEPKDNPVVGDHGLVYISEAKHGAISSLLTTPFKFEDKPFIVQYEVRFQKKHECGGAYVKLLADTPSLNVKEFTDKTPYSIMFGPDKCGGDGKLHFIFQHENPMNNKMEEKHAKKPSGDYNNIFDDGKTHLVTLIIKPDNTFEIQVDKKQVNQGSLLKDMEPPVNPPKEIDDPDDKKPYDWDEREKIPDETATKPDDWDEDAPKTISDPSASKPSGWLDDEPELVPDPEAVKPEDWDGEEDGEWEAPQINNPKCKAVGCGEWKAPMTKNPNYKGKWSAPLIANPKYKGIWKPKRIENPNSFEDSNPFAMKSIAAVGFELWSMQSDILFDNIIIADDVSVLHQWTAQTWDLKHTKEVEAGPSAVGGLWKSLMEATQEKPWLWVVLIGAVLLPIILIYVFCFGSKEDEAAVRKKTDAPVPDESEELEHEKSEGGEESTEPKIEEITEETKSTAPTIEEIREETENTEPKIEEITEETKNTEPKIEEITEETKEKTEEQKESEEEEKVIHEENEPEASDDLKTEKDEEDKEGSQEEKDASEEIPQDSPSPKTRTSKRKTRKDT